MTRAIVMNYGGGRQSVATVLLVVHGLLPRPERIVMARVAREKPATFAYLTAHVQPLLATIGMRVDVVEPDARVPGDYYGDHDLPLTPGWTSAQGRKPALCSGHWKRDLIHRWLRSQGYGPDRPVEQWICYSVDEKKRAKGGQRVQWIKPGYPLLTRVPLRVRDCLRVIEKAGLPPPNRSACYDCGNQANADWRQTRDETPELFQLAVRRDYALRERDPRHDLYLHNSGVPLDQANLDEDEEPGGDVLWTGGCNAAGCYT